MDPILAGLVISLLALWFGSIEVRMRNLDARLRKCPDRREVTDEIEVRQMYIKVLHQEIKEDIKQIRYRLDKLLDNITERK